jgi:hypothetical protein
MPTGENCKLINDDHEIKVVDSQTFFWRESLRGDFKRREPFFENKKVSRTNDER